MRRFDRRHYIASLRTKQGEFDAVFDLTPDVRDHTTVLWELQPSDATEEGEDPSRSLDDVVRGLPEKIAKASGGLEGFLDCGLVEPRRRHSSGTHPVAWICDRAATLGCLLTPVVTLQSDPDYVAAARTSRSSHSASSSSFASSGLGG
jgi:hypothetical protein